MYMVSELRTDLKRLIQVEDICFTSTLLMSISNGSIKNWFSMYIIGKYDVIMIY